MKKIQIEELLQLGDAAAYDAICRRVLANKFILAWILRSCTAEFKGYDIDTIISCIEDVPKIAEIEVMPDRTNMPLIHGMANEDTSISEGKVVYDIIFTVCTPGKERIRMIINIEAQNNFHPGYPLLMRVMYYLCRMVSAQNEREFVHSHYEDIKKVYSVWICTDPPKSMRNTITEYAMHENQLVGNAKAHPAHYDLMRAVIVGLSDEEDEDKQGLLRMLDVLLTSSKTVGEKREILKSDFDIEMTDEMNEEVSIMCNLSQGILEKGLKQGREEGITDSLRNIMKSLKMTAEQAMEVLNIPQNELGKYKTMLNSMPKA